MIGRLPLRVTAPGAALLLAGCVSAPAAHTPLPTPSVPTYNVAGLEGVMGKSAGAIQALLGTADLDVREGNARKLQFIGPACVLDAYLAPPQRGGEAVVSWVDARLPDGRDFDRASCAAALRAKQQVR